MPTRAAVCSTARLLHINDAVLVDSAADGMEPSCHNSSLPAHREPWQTADLEGSSCLREHTLCVWGCAALNAASFMNMERKCSGGLVIVIQIAY